MAVLDCSTRESTIDSLVRILDIDRNSLHRAINDFYYYDYIQSHPWPVSASDQKTGEGILLALKKTVNPSVIEYANYFHVTRCSDPSIFFDRGLQPLGEVLNDIWTFLFGLLRDELSLEEWNLFRKESETTNLWNCDNYKSKIQDRSVAEGPFGFLIREIAFNPSPCSNVDYYRMGSEIVGDICNCFEGYYSLDLLKRYLEATKSCIVKFRALNKAGAVETALYYLYLYYHKMEFDDFLNCCFDGKGKTVEPDAIEEVEII